VRHFLLLSCLLLLGTPVSAQTESDKWPPALVGIWTWHGLDNSMEANAMLLELKADGQGHMAGISDEELSSGTDPIIAFLTWRVEYPNWPDRSGRQLCFRLKLKNPGAEEDECSVYRFWGTKPQRELWYIERHWKECATCRKAF